MKKKDYRGAAKHMYKSKGKGIWWNKWHGNVSLEILTTVTEAELKLQCEYDNYDDVLIGATATQGVGRLKWKRGRRTHLLNHMMEFSSKPYLHGGLPKHWAVMDEFTLLFEQAAKCDIPIILIGPSYWEHCERLHEIKNCFFVPIRGTKAIKTIGKTIKQVKRKVNALGKEPLILSGASHLSALILLELKKRANKDFFFMDVGKALDLRIHRAGYIGIPGRWLDANWVSRVEKARKGADPIYQAKKRNNCPDFRSKGGWI
jgi:hypothetical protein